LIDKEHEELSIRRQCALLQLNRAGYYYEPRPFVSDEDIILMDEIDQIYTKCPFYGWPRITEQLHQNGYLINHKRVYRLMKLMGIEAVFPGKNLSTPDKSHQIYPYLLKGLKIERPNQVWGVDITYVRLKNEFLYLVAIMDWFSRYIISWELSDSMSVGFCRQTLQNALIVGIPEIHNSDQGSQFTSEEYVSLLKDIPTIKISMDHKGRCFDNIFTERLWRTIKYEEVYLKGYESPREARSSLREYITFYNEERFHSSLDYQTPAKVYITN